MPECWPQENGNITASAINAALAGKLKLGGGTEYINGWFTDTADQATWKLMVPPGGGEYSVQLTYACADKDAGSSFEIVVGDSKIRATLQAEAFPDPQFYWGFVDPLKAAPPLPATGLVDIDKLVPVSGLLRLPGGPQTLKLVPMAINNGNSLKLRGITLTPAKK
jgi:hypothetical protein